MKKQILYAGAMLMLSTAVNAQTKGWAETGAFDDFSQEAFYKNGPNMEGVVWFADPVFEMERTGNGVMTISTDSAGGVDAFPLFGLNFNDSNDNGTGTPFTLDLSNGADITFDIENGSDQLLISDIKLVDINDVQTEIEPNVSDVTPSTTFEETPFKRKALNGFTLASGARKTITIDLSSVPEVIGGLSIVSYDNCNQGPFFCPETAYSIDITKIKAVLFRVNFGGNNIDLSEGDGDHTIDTPIPGSEINAFKGDIILHSFLIGTGTVGLEEEAIESSLKTYPNPVKNNLVVTYDAISKSQLSLKDVYGNDIYSQTTKSGTTKSKINTTDFVEGIYVLTVETANGVITRKIIIE